MSDRGKLAGAWFALAALAVSACSSSSDVEPVRIVDIDSSGGHMSTKFAFLDPSGSEVPQSAMEDGSLEADLPDGGSVSWSYRIYGSPTAGSHYFSLSVDQVEPGDEIDLTGPSVPLPEGCTCHYATDAVPDVEVDARIRTRAPSAPCQYPPCQSTSSSRRIDGRPELGQSGSTLFISCETLDYADLRPYVAKLSCPRT